MFTTLQKHFKIWYSAINKLYATFIIILILIIIIILINVYKIVNLDNDQQFICYIYFFINKAQEVVNIDMR